MSPEGRKSHIFQQVVGNKIFGIFLATHIVKGFIIRRRRSDKNFIDE